MAAWTYSDYRTYAYGATRLSRFNLHIQEVSDEVNKERSGYGRSVSSNANQQYLNKLLSMASEEENKNDRASGSISTFTRGKPLLT